MTDGPIVADGVRLAAQECQTCIFAPGNRMSLQPGRVRSMVDAAVAADSFIVCHSTLHGERAICRGFHDRYGHRTLGCRLAQLQPILVDPDA